MCQQPSELPFRNLISQKRNRNTPTSSVEQLSTKFTIPSELATCIL